MPKRSPLRAVEMALLTAEANGVPVRTKSGAAEKKRCPRCGLMGLLRTSYRTDDVVLRILLCVNCHHEVREGAIKKPKGGDDKDNGKQDECGFERRPRKGGSTGSPNDN